MFPMAARVVMNVLLVMAACGALGVVTGKPSSPDGDSSLHSEILPASDTLEASSAKSSGKRDNHSSHQYKTFNAEAIELDTHILPTENENSIIGQDYLNDSFQEVEPEIDFSVMTGEENLSDADTSVDFNATFNNSQAGNSASFTNVITTHGLAPNENDKEAKKMWINEALWKLKSMPKSNRMRIFRAEHNPSSNNDSVKFKEITHRPFKIYSRRQFFNTLRGVANENPEPINTTKRGADIISARRNPSLFDQECKKPCHRRDSFGLCRLDFACSVSHPVIGPPDLAQASIIGANGCARCHLSDYSGRCRLILSCFVRNRW